MTTHHVYLIFWIISEHRVSDNDLSKAKGGGGEGDAIQFSVGTFYK